MLYKVLCAADAVTASYLERKVQDNTQGTAGMATPIWIFSKLNETLKYGLHVRSIFGDLFYCLLNANRLLISKLVV